MLSASKIKPNIKWPWMDDTLEQKAFSKEDEMFWNIFQGNSIQYGSVTDLCSRFWLEIDMAVWMIDSIEVYVLTSRRWIVNSIIDSNIYVPGRSQSQLETSTLFGLLLLRDWLYQLVMWLLEVYSISPFLFFTYLLEIKNWLSYATQMRYM